MGITFVFFAILIKYYNKKYSKLNFLTSNTKIGRFNKIIFRTMVLSVHLFSKKNFFMRINDNKSFLHALFLLLNKKIYIYRNKYNLFFEKLNIFQNYQAKYNLFYVKNKIEYLMNKICFKTKSSIKKFIEYYQKYLFFFFSKELNNKKYIFIKKPKRILLFNLDLKYIRKTWYSKFNYIQNYLNDKFKKKRLPNLIEKYILAEKKFLTIKNRSLNLTVDENKFFLDFFFISYKINSKLNSTLNFFEKKKIYSKIIFRKSKPVFFIHQKILGFAPKILFTENNIKKITIFSGKILKKFTD